MSQAKMAWSFHSPTIQAAAICSDPPATAMYLRPVAGWLSFLAAGNRDWLRPPKWKSRDRSCHSRRWCKSAGKRACLRPWEKISHSYPNKNHWVAISWTIEGMVIGINASLHHPFSEKPSYCGIYTHQTSLNLNNSSHSTGWLIENYIFSHHCIITKIKRILLIIYTVHKYPDH